MARPLNGGRAQHSDDVHALCGDEVSETFLWTWEEDQTPQQGGVDNKGKTRIGGRAMTQEQFDQLTEEIGNWFAHLKLTSFRKTFRGDVYPSSALVTDYDYFVEQLRDKYVKEDKK